MARHLTTFSEKARIYKQVQRNTDFDEHSSGQKWKHISERKIDMSIDYGQFDLSEIGIHEITTKGQLIKALEAIGMPAENGIYFLGIRDTIIQPKVSKKDTKKRNFKHGRPMYSRPALKELGIVGRPRQAKMGGTFNFVLKFEAIDGKITDLFEFKSKRKRKPYTRTKYELLQKIEDNLKAMEDAGLA